MSKKYQKLYFEWDNTAQTIDFATWLDQRRDERKAGKMKKDNGYNVNLVQALQQCAKWFGEYIDIHSVKANEEKVLVNAARQTYCLNAIDNASNGHDYTPHLWSEPVPLFGDYLAYYQNGKVWVRVNMGSVKQKEFTSYTHWMHIPPVPEAT
jgi:hypothetical protein